jgi:hypothetical protein
MSNLKVMRDGIRIGKFIFRERFRTPVRRSPASVPASVAVSVLEASLMPVETTKQIAVAEATLP